MVSTSYQSDLLFVILGGAIIFAASVFCAAWLHSHLSRIAKLNDIKATRAAEKAQIAKVQAMRERELNEFIAHEVGLGIPSSLWVATSNLIFADTGTGEKSTVICDFLPKLYILGSYGVCCG